MVSLGQNISVNFNTFGSGAVQCGHTSGKVHLAGSTVSVVTFALSLDESAPVESQATVTMSGPDGVWFGVGLGATVMADTPNAIIVLGNGTVFEQKMADQPIGTRLPTSIKVVSNIVAAGKRTVTVTRGLKGMTPGNARPPIVPQKRRRRRGPASA